MVNIAHTGNVNRAVTSSFCSSIGNLVSEEVWKRVQTAVTDRIHVAKQIRNRRIVHERR